MCGIAGIIDHENKLANKTEILTRMSEALAHRGPDEHGIYISAPAFIAHRRLSVIDPAFGKQPMTRIYENKKYTITYNGEIYNAEEIKKELIEIGYEIKTNCDTEIVLLSFIEYKENCLKKLNGIFSFAIFISLLSLSFTATGISTGSFSLTFTFSDTTVVSIFSSVSSLKVALELSSVKIPVSDAPVSAAHADPILTNRNKAIAINKI